MADWWNHWLFHLNPHHENCWWLHRAVSGGCWKSLTIRMCIPVSHSKFTGYSLATVPRSVFDFNSAIRSKLIIFNSWYLGGHHLDVWLWTLQPWIFPIPIIFAISSLWIPFAFINRAKWLPSEDWDRLIQIMLFDESGIKMVPSIRWSDAV